MRFRTLLQTSAVASLLGAGLLLGGCYRNVVGVKGPSNQTINVSEPNIQPGESFWEEDKPRPVETDRYSNTTLGRAKPVPSAPKPKPES